MTGARLPFEVETSSMTYLVPARDKDEFTVLVTAAKPVQWAWARDRGSLWADFAVEADYETLTALGHEAQRLIREFRP